MNKTLKIILPITVFILVALAWFSSKHSDDIQLSVISDSTNNVAPPEFKFTDVSQQAGIDFIHNNSAFGEKLLPETMGSGVAATDLDGDGDIDLIFVSANRWPWQQKKQKSSALSIYLNDGKGSFSKKSYPGISESFYGVGIAVADINADNRKDIYITALGRNYLYLNTGDDFIESAEASGVAGESAAWSTGSTFFDYDNDGDLDLLYGNYVNWDKETDLQVNYTLTGIGKAYGPPTDFSATALKLYNNDGTGNFTDVSIASGLASNSSLLKGKSLVVQPLDIDNDGALDIFVANDTTRNFLFHNLSNGTFEEKGEMLGVAYDNAGHATGAMGVDVGYFGKANEQMIAVGNFANEMTSYFVKHADEDTFSELSILSGFGPDSRKSLTFGVMFVDLNNDGRDDFFQVNGHVENEINKVQTSQNYRQPPQLFWNCGDQCSTVFVPTKTFSEMTLVARGLASADIDADGDLDLIITQVGAPAVLLRNDTASKQKWLRIKLHQQQGNQDAIGSTVILKTKKITRQKLLMPTRGYLSQSETLLSFAVPEETSTVEISINWPDGSHSSHNISEFRKVHTIIKPKE